ncbi:hypothetical protein FJZ31_34570 [Candidatus Poribacteria bacterium]|nr:hypothetical protein [Candidatus Poribacteria bacterium]
MFSQKTSNISIFDAKRNLISIIAFLLIALMVQIPAFAQEGTRESGEVTSPALKDNLYGDPETRVFEIYLPPSYKTSDKRYPVIYVLHGHGAKPRKELVSPGGMFNHIKPAMDSMLRDGKIKEMIAVFADGGNKLGGNFYLNSETTGDYETYITKDLVNYIDANYRTIAERNSRGITGGSMGGYGAMHLALKYPEIFGAVVAQGGFYSVEIDGFRESWIFPLASVNATNWSELEGSFWKNRTALAYISGACPNPNKPPFFLDMPCEMVDGKAQIVPEVWQRMKDYDIIHGHLPRYVKNPVKLNAIMFVHGVTDDVLSVSQARSLDQALTELGIEHVYDEHNGGHEFIPEKSLQFLSEHLSDRPVETGKKSTEQGGVTMFARFTIAQVKSGKMDELAKIYEESIVPAAKAQKGYQGAYLLTNPETGKAISITVWDSEADAIANEQSGYYQEQVAKAKDCFAAPPIREGYEITVADAK